MKLLKKKRKHPGRPPWKRPEEKRIRISIFLAPDTLQWLDQQSESRGEVIDELVKRKIEKS